jgi:hypothetical protein
VHRAHFVVGMRLHLLIFAAIAGVPFLPLPYSGKVLDLAEAVGAPSSPGMAEAQAGPLLAIPDRLWGERDRHVPLVRERARELQEHAETTWQRCATVLGVWSTHAPPSELQVGIGAAGETRTGGPAFVPCPPAGGRKPAQIAPRGSMRAARPPEQPFTEGVGIRRLRR